MKRRIALGFLFALLLLSALVGVVGVHDVRAELQEVSLSLYSLGFVAAAIALTLRASVWVQMVRLVDERAPRLRIAAVFLVAMFAKYSTPYGQVTTEPLMAYVVANYTDMSYEDGLASIVVADLFNYVPYYSLGAVGLGYLLLSGPLDPDLVIYIVALGIFAVAIVLLTVVVLYRRSIVVRAGFLTGRVVRGTVGRLSTTAREVFARPTIRERFDSFYATIDLFARDRRSVLLAIAVAHLGMVFLMLPLYIVALAAGYHIALPLIALIAAIGKMGVVIPTPGGVGGVEAALAAALVIVAGLPVAAATTIAILYRVCIYWFTIAIGATTYGLGLAKL